MAHKIVTIEPSEPIRRIMALLIEGISSDRDIAGYKVRQFNNARDGLRAVLEPGVELLVTEVAGIGENAVSFLAAVNALRPNLPIIVVTHYPGTIPAHGRVILSKPFDVDEFIKEVKRAVE